MAALTDSSGLSRRDLFLNGTCLTKYTTNIYIVRYTLHVAYSVSVSSLCQQYSLLSLQVLA